MITEQSSLYNDLEKKKVRQILREINKEDAKVAKAVKDVIPKVELLVKQLVDRLKNGGRIFYVGAGTSGRLAVLDASELPPTFGVSPSTVQALIAGGEKALRYAVENAEDDRKTAWDELMNYEINKLDTVIGVSASGSTPYVLGALESARDFGLLTAAIVCNYNSPMAQVAEIVIDVIVGPEYLTASTRLKCGTAQKMILNMISTATMIQLGRVHGNTMEHLQLTNAKLLDRAVRMIMSESKLPYQQSKDLLLTHGSVRKALNALKR
jgi:N-acetylmuramic acid 6-phosphate etherase